MRTRSSLRVILSLVFALAWAGLLPVVDSSKVPAPRLVERKSSDTKKDEKADEKKKEEGLPLKPERKVEFTTDEGTWISLDVSPDSKTVLFELLGHLYTVPIAGGDAKRITAGMQFDSQPRYSPDGSQIVFISDRDGGLNIWVAKADGSDPKAITKEKQMIFASPRWMRDGKAILVAREQMPIGAFEIWMYYVQGGSGVQVTKAKPPKPDARPDEWVHTIGGVESPDGKYLYYTKRPQLFHLYNVEYPLSQIVRRNLTTGEEDTITSAIGSGIAPALSPDGSLLVYGTRHDGETGLRVRDLKTGEEHWLKYPVQHDEQESLFTRDLLPGYAFTPDGKDVVVSYGGKIHRVNVVTGTDQLISFSVHISQDIGPKLYFPTRVEEGPVRARLIQEPSQSPDGKWLAFSCLTHVYTMAIPGGAPKRLTNADEREFQPSWSPDGQWIAFVTWSEKGGQIWKMRVNGSGSPQQLTRTPAYYREPMWSPDGSRIVALRGAREAHVEEPDEFGGAPGGLDLVWIPSSGGDANLILPARGAIRPHFTKEADRIYVYTEAGLLSMRYDGTDRRKELQVAGKGFVFEKPDVREQPADDVRISPDGQWALAKVNYQVYVLASKSQDLEFI